MVLYRFEKIDGKAGSIRGSEMNLRKYITEKTIKMVLCGTTPEAILRELVELLADAGKINRGNIDDAVRALIRRENMMSTGIQDGVAIPHAKSPGVKDLVGGLGLVPGGVDFNSLDGKPSKIFVVTLSPKGAAAPHVPFLAEVCKLLNHRRVRERLLSAKSPREVLDILFH